MFDLKKLAADHAKLCNEYEELIGTAAEYEGKSDPSEDDKKKLEAAKAAVEEKKKAMDGIEGKMLLAKDVEKRRAASRELAGLATPEASQGQTAPFSGEAVDDTTGAKAIDHRKAERDEVNAFFEYCKTGGLGDVPDKLRDRMTPSGKAWTADAQGGIRLPASMAASIFAHRIDPYVGKSVWDMPRGKAIGDDPFLTADANFPEVMAPPEFMVELLSLPPEPMFLFQMVRKVPTKTGTIRWPKVTRTDADEFGGLSVSFISEGGEKPLDEPVFEQISISTNELAARAEIGRTLLSRSVVDIQAFLRNEFRGAIMNKIDETILFGSGVGEPAGIFGATGLRTQAREVNDEVSYTDLVKLDHQLRWNHRSTAAWIMADAAVEQLRLKLDGEQRPLFVRDVLTSTLDRMFGRPLFPTHRLSLGNNDVLTADTAQYIMPIEQDIVVMRSDHRLIEKNIVVFVIFMQVGGQFVHPRAGAKLQNKEGTS